MAGDHEEQQQLEDAVDHRRHVDLTLVRTAVFGLKAHDELTVERGIVDPTLSLFWQRPIETRPLGVARRTPRTSLVCDTSTELNRFGRIEISRPVVENDLRVI